MILQVALTGGLATGKSVVGHILEELGCFLIQADELGHEVLAPGGLAYHQVLQSFRTVDRKALASIVFKDNDRLRELTEIIHPAVETLRLQRIAEIAKQNPDAVVVCEAAIYIETGSIHKFDKVILTVCGRELQIARAMERNNWSREESERRLAHQMSDEAKRKFADYVIDTSGSLHETRQQTVQVYNSLIAL